ncbi:hypothetical protein ATZ36_05525 [Candidatus Endomicrobiellum trichonymphae]|uniref:Aldehyde dehydrogenase domain-containing protein n=1 Tax=Endomicrobium trichonymphae TaxID=1408204 RepID=A0A1E5II98_ENDTX|nr:hypothetical protein ATZ36_05525 [Candidatus Endomicrobium trichonymphae]
MDTKVLAGEVSKISLEEEFAQEKLSPVIAIYRAENFEDAVEKAHRLVELCGAGHTSVLYTDERRQNRINAFAGRLRTCRIFD